MIIEQDGMRRELTGGDSVFNQSHAACEQCDTFVCCRNIDGTSDCTSCSHESGEELHDADGKTIGFLHDDCREPYTLALAVDRVHAALKVRLPLGLEVWAAERARNIVDGLRAEFVLKLR